MDKDISINSCRVCLSNPGLVEIFKIDDKQKTIADMIIYNFDIDVNITKIFYDVNLPYTICMQCLEKIKISTKLKNDILQSQILLKTYLEKSLTSKSNMYTNDGDQNRIQDLTNADEVKNDFLMDDSSGDVDTVVNNLTVSKVKSIQESPPEKFIIPLSTVPDSYNCEFCEFITNAYKSLINHIKIHSEINLYECERCGKQFKQRSVYNKHARIHYSVKSFECKFCKKGFRTSSGLNQHLLTHKTDKIFPCPQCDKKFCHTKGLKSHLIFHNEKNVMCTICGKKFKHTTFLVGHMNYVHGNKIRKKTSSINILSNGEYNDAAFNCEVCGKLYKTNIGLKLHFNRMHTSKKTFVCKYCNEIFKTANSLTLHTHQHVDLMDPATKELYRKLKCTVCGKLFAQSFFIKKHMVLHSGNKEYVCTYCGKSYPYKNYLIRHVRGTHERNNSNNYICKVCDRAFIYASDLKFHMRVHTGEKAYHCQLCDSKFKYPKSLRIHMRNQHETKSKKS